MPKVSIIIPLYNKVDYITETIQSVLSQIYLDWETIVVDNASTDGSWEKAQQIQDPRLRFLQSPKRGPGAARNYGLASSRGEWVQFLDADDLLEPDHLEQQLAAAQKNPDAEIIACCWQEFTARNPDIRILKTPAGFGQPIQVLRDAAVAFAPWAVHAALVKHSALSSDFYWPEELDQYLGEDIAFWFKLISKYNVVYGTSQGALYRTQTACCRTQRFNPQKWFEGVHTAIQKNLDYIADEKQKITSAKSEHLMRAYSSIYLLACAKKSQEIQQRSLVEASQWLNQYFQRGDQLNVSMIIRRCLGLKLFLQLVNLGMKTISNR